MTSDEEHLYALGFFENGNGTIRKDLLELLHPSKENLESFKQILVRHTSIDGHINHDYLTKEYSLSYLESSEVNIIITWLYSKSYKGFSSIKPIKRMMALTKIYGKKAKQREFHILTRIKAAKEITEKKA